MKIARIAVLCVALLAAGGAGLVALTLSAPEPVEPIIITAEPAEPPIKLTEVLVAGRDIPMGESVNDALAWQKWPEDGVSSTFIQKNHRASAVDDLKGSIARQAFFAGEPIREAKLIKTDRGFMSAILPAGKRAVAVQISADTSAGGFILPNDHVDVIMTRRRVATTSGGEASTDFDTETVLTNLRVLAIDQTIEEQNGAKVVVGSTATLEVDGAQAEALTAAQQMAERLVLSLRSLADSVPGSDGYAQFLLEGDRRPGKIRIVRYGQTTDITPKK
ncbi:Flp pilus assembly protein CpaB [Aureimonas sp. Leaf454]|uniref:Flp pilus assembly protein CpaB n=1 Tax=Aureimonas sp. Leaf454 TaxID=1736381 RepID=UPI0006F772DD|nr:Flp pilus assembly protein CpaB [Aureimonas sp. Leaf454]KQT44649.1 Flp pilus assembly protein CpaB [Aureimonas sp. Leaf454]